MDATRALPAPLDALGLAGSITTVISLAALAIIAAFLLARQWLRTQQRTVEKAIASGDNALLTTVIGTVDVPLDALSPEQKYELAREQLRSRSGHKTLVYALVFLSFLALLGFIIMLVRNGDTDVPPRARTASSGENTGGTTRRQLDPFDMLFILGKVPPSDRPAACRRMMEESDCQRAEEIFVGLVYSAPTSEQRATITDVIDTGTVTDAELRDLAVCDGDFRFVIVQNLLRCAANGRTIPFVEAKNLGRPLESREALVFHYTASSSLTGVLSYLTDADSQATGSAHLLVSRAGAVVQLAPFNVTTSHVGAALWQGRPGLNRRSLSIELVNLGPVSNGADGTVGPGQPAVRSDEVVRRTDSAGRATTWQSYPRVQIDVAKALAAALVSEYRIPAIIGHSDVDPRRSDPGPAFPIDEIRKAAGVN